MSSCHDFLMPGAEGGVATGIALRVAKLSLIKLQQLQTRRKGRRPRTEQLPSDTETRKKKNKTFPLDGFPSSPSPIRHSSVLTSIEELSHVP